MNAFATVGSRHRTSVVLAAGILFLSYIFKNQCIGRLAIEFKDDWFGGQMSMFRLEINGQLFGKVTSVLQFPSVLNKTSNIHA